MHSFAPYYVFLIPIAVGFIVQSTKFVIFGLKHGWKWEYLATHGHMPSGHTGFVVAVATSIGYYEGMSSGAFAAAVALAIIVIDDAARLRVYMGDQGRYLNMLIRQLNISEEQFPRLKERVGHRISEVIVGGLMGFVLTVLFARLLS